MSQAPDDAADLEDVDAGPVLPEPPRRVPFAVAVTTALLGLLALLLAIGALLTLSTTTAFDDGVAEATVEGLGTGVIAICAALVAAVAWSFVRNGNTVGPIVVAAVTVFTGLIFLVSGVVGDSPDTDGLRVGVLALMLGLGVLLVPLFGHGPGYLAARRVWAQAEQAWLGDLTSPATAITAPQHWPGQAFPPPPQWGAYPQGYPAPQPGFPPQYQYPYPPQQPQPWAGPPQQPQQQPWPEAAVPPWTGQQPPAAPAQQAPTEPIPTTEQPAAPREAPPGP